MRGKRKISAELVILLIVVAAFLWDPVANLLGVDRSHWHRLDGNAYYYNQTGDQVLGWEVLDGKTFYLNPDKGGALHTGWLELEGKRYYFDETGAMATGWLRSQEACYYLNTDGTMATGWVADGAAKYYMDLDGQPVTGWQTLEGQRYYFSHDGLLATGWLELEEGRYYLGADGAMTTGWVTHGDQRYYLSADGTAYTGWLEQDGQKCYLDSSGALHRGWLDWEGQRYYLDEQGHPVTGWLELEDRRYYLDADGILQTGWLEQDGKRYYLQENGAAAIGKLIIDEKTYYFTSTGAEILLVNLWNPLPEDYSVKLVYRNGARVAESCADALQQMLADCRAAGYTPYICSSYRTVQTQQGLLSRKVGQWMAKGYSYNDAYAKAIQIVAVPGTSEHHTGLAVDIIDANWGALNATQAERPTQIWLMENCWRYGFILRYPANTTESTGIIYEPWHYRYVGTELSMELYELDMCLEDYLDMLTQRAQENP